MGEMPLFKYTSMSFNLTTAEKCSSPNVQSYLGCPQSSCPPASPAPPSPGTPSAADGLSGLGTSDRVQRKRQSIILTDKDDQSCLSVKSFGECLTLMMMS